MTRIKPVDIEEELKNSYLDYAMSVIVSRALPDIRDGLKPVQRRILFALHQLGLRPNTPSKKSARAVGEVLGKYHPHGDAPVYEAMVRLAQDFTMSQPLVQGQGNFGSIDDDPPAAMRYTEVRLAAIAMEMLEDIEKDTVDFVPNFDASTSEPVVLPTRFPNLLVNGSTGIAVGMATNIPPHNLAEVCEAISLLIDNPEATLEEIMEVIKGPDFPTAGFILGREGIKEAYSTGQGRLVLQAKVQIEEPSRDNPQIIVTQLPYQTNKAALVGRIAHLSKEKKIEGIAEVRDESDRHGIRIVVELKREGQPQVVLNQLFKQTPLRTAFNANMLALVAGQPQTLNLKQFLQHHIAFRQQVLTRRSQFELREAKDRAHILEGLRVALDNLDEIIALIRSSPSAEAAHGALVKRFALTPTQAQAILDMPLRRLAGLERQKVLDELAEVIKTISYLEDLLANPRKLLHLIQEEVKALKAKYGQPRRTQLEEAAEELAAEDLIPRQPVLVAVHQRYVKRLSPDTFRLRRAQVGAQLLASSSSHDYILFFTKKGRVYALKAYNIPSESRTARGVPLVTLLSLKPEEEIACLLPLPSLSAPGYLLLASRRGKIKKTPLAELASLTRRGLPALRVGKGDELVAVTQVEEGEEAIMVSQEGKALHLPPDFRPRHRQAGGILGVRLEPQDGLVALERAPAQGHLLTLTSGGYAKLTPLSYFRLQGRGGKGLKAHRLTPKTGPLIAARLIVNTSSDMLVLTSQGQALRLPLKTLPIKRRGAAGRLALSLHPEDKLVGLILLEASSP